MNETTFLTRNELAKRWSVSISTINKLARTKPDMLPPSLKVAGVYRYNLADVISFEKILTNYGDCPNE